jgi:hypothetical protein
MAQAAIFGPFFAMIFLTFLVWVYMYIRRISFITGNKISSDDLAAPALSRGCRRPPSPIPRIISRACSRFRCFFTRLRCICS